MSLQDRFTDREIKNIMNNLICLAKTKLNKKQKKIILILNKENPDKNATKLVSSLSLILNCSPSSLWSILRSLRSLKLISCGIKNEKGKM